MLTIKLAVLDVGQGDTIVITSPETQEAIVVDCVDVNKVLSYLKSEEIKYLNGVIITHPHYDHWSDISALITNCNGHDFPKCEKLLFNHPHHFPKDLIEDSDKHSNLPPIHKKKNKPFLPFVRAAKDKKIPTDSIDLSGYEPVSLSNRLSLNGELAKQIYLLHPHKNHLSDPTMIKNWNLNNLSATLLIESQGSSALLTGDLEAEGWDTIIQSGFNVKCDVIKFPHHGVWRKGDAVAFMKDVNPNVVIISVGASNTYNHPSDNVFSAIAQFPNIRLLCTQATKKCVPNISQDEINKIKNILSDNNAVNYLTDANGCSCAGTVIIELSDEAKILQPSRNTHINRIIKPHFTNHQCIIPETSTNQE